jgi:hypothetical protein
VKDAPPYNPAVPVDRMTETYIYNHYDRPGYWMDDSKHES